ncbi:TPA: tail fiber domain-containing protein [Streptococcus pneumoniae]|nr:tail fiber domain-containing protein [Streptococcus pneumoniae]HEU4090055.1 tail fiber domain-containing protein [Streptococcus pneumoniae]HEU4094364.1 tail fiber domain-containing protein [Streptococcus pneumoniae]HEU4108031.1 tail fiber domain-containing protein [Streptococcus pneumoniae]HEU4196115.1 tail fiber domain-containing protein [Streptococcus pneumoniae]
MFAKERTLAIRVGEYASRDIKEASFEYGYIKGDTYKPGGTCAGSGKITFTSIITTFNKLDTLHPEIGLLVGDTYQWVKMGEYFINDIEIDRNRNTTTLELMDGMFKLNREYVTDLHFPAEVREVIQEICLKTGIELANDYFGISAMRYHIEQVPEGKKLSFRDMLSAMTQMIGMSCFFNREGKMEIRDLTESNITINADSYFLHGLTKSEIEYQIAGITCKTDKKSLTVGMTTGRSLELDNVFITQSALNDLYYKLKNLTYYPYNLNYQGHLLLEVGQWVTIQTNKKETFKVPVLSQSFIFKGGLRGRISADSKAGNDTQYSYEGTITKQIKQQDGFEAKIQAQIEAADKDFDQKVDKIKKDFNDQVELAKARAEEVKRELSDTINQRFNSFDNGPLKEAKRKAEEALRNAGASSSLAQESKRIGLDSVARLEAFKSQTTSAQTALSGDLDALKRTIANDIRPKQAQAEAEIAKQVEALSRTKNELDGASTLLAQEAKRIELDSVARLEAFKSQTTSAQTALSGDLDVLKRTIANDIRPKQAQAEAEIAKQVEALSRTKNELAGVKSAQATYEETTTRRLSELTNLANGKASKSELTQTAEELASRIASVQASGRNLFLNSLFKQDISKTGIWTTSTYTATIDSESKYLGYNALKIIGLNPSGRDGGNPKVTYPVLGQFGKVIPGSTTNQDVTISFYAKANKNGIMLRSRLGNIGYKTGNVTLSTEIKRYVVHIPKGWTNESKQTTNEWLFNFNQEGTVWIWMPKFEISDVDTSYSEAPEDIEGQISTVESTFKQRVNSLEAGVNRLTEGLRTKVDISALNVTAENIRQSVKSLETDTQNKLNQKLSQAEFEVRAGSIRQEILNATKDKADKTLVVSEAGKLREEFSKMKVGGRNLWIKSKTVGAVIEKLPENHVTGQKECYRLENNSTLTFNLEPDFSSRLYQKVTFSAWIKYENVVQGRNFWNVFNCFKHYLFRKNSETGVQSGPDYATLGMYKGSADWKYITFTYDYSEKTNFDQLKTSLRFNLEGATSGTAWVTGIKVEIGSVATDWSPAPEDGENELLVAKTEFKRTADGLSTKMAAVESYVGQDGQRQEALQRYTREESARQATAVRELVNRDFVGKATYQEDVKGINQRIEAVKTSANTEGLRTKVDISALNVTAENIRQSVKSLETDTQNKLNQKLSQAEFEVRAGSIRQEILNATKDKADKTLVVSEAGKLREEFSKMKVGGRNLWIKSKTVGAVIEKLPENHVTGQKECYRLENNSTLTFNLEPDFSSRLYQKVTFSAWIKYENVVQGRNFWNVFNCFKHYLFRKNSETGVQSGPDYATLGMYKGSADWKYITFTYDYSEKTNFDQLKTSLRFNLEGATSGTAWVTGIKVEIGSVATDWSPAPEDADGLITEAKATFERTAQGLRTDLSAIQEYVNKDGQRQEALQRYTREESTRQATAVRELVNRDFVGKVTYQEDVKGINQRIEAVKTSANKDIASQIASYRQSVDGKFTDISSQITTYKQDVGGQISGLSNRLTSSEQGTTTQISNLSNRINSNKQGTDNQISNLKTQVATNKDNAERQMGRISDQVSANKANADSQFANVTNQLVRKVETTDFQRVKETSKLYERILGNTENGIADKVARMALTNQLFQVEVGKYSVSGPNLIKNSDFKNATNEWGSTQNLGRLVKHSFYHNGQKDLMRLSNATKNENFLYSHRFNLERNTDYVLNFRGFNNSALASYDVYILGRRAGESDGFTIVKKVVSSKKLSTSRCEDVSVTFNSGEMDNAYIRFDNNGSSSGTADLYITEVDLYKGYKPRTWQPHPEDAVADANKKLEATQTKMTQLAGSWVVENINSAGDIISGINLGANGHNRLVGKLTHITGETLIDRAVIKSAMVDKLKTANFEAGSVTTTILEAEAVTAEKLKVDDALIRKLTANDAFIDRLTSKRIFSTKVESVISSSTFLEAYQGRIGGFTLGQFDQGGGRWISGVNQFSVGMGNGAGHGVRTAFWANWGNNWNYAGPKAWNVNTDGKMYCRNEVGFYDQVDFSNSSRANFYGNTTFSRSPVFSNGIELGSKDVLGDGWNPKGGRNAVVWWNQVGSGSVKYWMEQKSDRRLKENITDTAVKALDKINRLRMVAFDFIENKKHEEIGLIAQEAETIVPRIVSRDPENPDGYLHIDYTALVPYLIKAIQELNQKIEKMEKTIA